MSSRNESNEHNSNHSDDFDIQSSSVEKDIPDYVYDDYDDESDYDEVDYSDEIKRPKRKSKLPIWLKIIIVILLLFIIFIFGCILFINHQLNKIGREPANLETIAPEDEYFETDEPPIDEEGNVIEEVDPDTIVWDESDDVYYDENVINILLIGQDRRPGETRARSDSMIILSINKNNNTIKMTSLMRDLYVQIPGYSDNRINASYAWGGMKLLDETIKKNFGIRIDKNIEVDFTAFTKIIDEIGGVDIEITEKEASYLTKNGYASSAGSVHMDGDYALTYSRIRYIDSDFVRTSRQRNVIQAIFKKMRNESITEWYSLTNTIFPLLTTDMTNSEIVNYLYIAYEMHVSSIESYRVPADGTYSNQYVRKMAVLVPDLKANRNYLLKNIYNIEN